MEKHIWISINIFFIGWWSFMLKFLWTHLNHADFIGDFCYCKLNMDSYKHINIALLLL